MFMKQDIWDIYFQTRVRNGFNVPEPADHHFACIVSISACLCGGVVSFWGGEGAGYGDWERGRVMSCCNNKQILMIYYKSAARASAWGDWGGWQLLTHTPHKCLADDVCVFQIINHRVHTRTHTHKSRHHTFTKTCFSTHTQVHKHKIILVWSHVCCFVLFFSL